MKIDKKIILGVLCVLVLQVNPLWAKQKKKSIKIKTKNKQQEYVVSKDQTSFDFSEAVIDGSMKIPQGFFLQGRQAQSLRQMVKLRTNFRDELLDSNSAVKSIVK